MIDTVRHMNHEADWTRHMPKVIAQMILDEIESNPQACTTEDKIAAGVGPFGLTPSNPVPVFGIPSNEIYLSRLRTQTGQQISWKRIGSLYNETVKKSIDEYEVCDSDGTFITYIYISPYHWRTSQKAPEGFIIAG